MIITDEMTLWVCTDCLYAAAGFDDHELGRESDPFTPEPLSLLGEDYGTRGTLTPGLMATEHADDCTVFVAGDYRGEGDCDCETRTFSWTHCEGCGCTFGGTRYALTFFTHN